MLTHRAVSAYKWYAWTGPRGFSLRDYRQHLVHTLRKQGYWSALIGEQHISKDPGIIGYDRVYKIETTHVKAVAPLATEILRNSPQQPFFLSVGFFETHRGFFRTDLAPGCQLQPSAVYYP